MHRELLRMFTTSFASEGRQPPSEPVRGYRGLSSRSIRNAEALYSITETRSPSREREGAGGEFDKSFREKGSGKPLFQKGFSRALSALVPTCFYVILRRNQAHFNVIYIKRYNGQTRKDCAESSGNFYSRLRDVRRTHARAFTRVRQVRHDIAATQKKISLQYLHVCYSFFIFAGGLEGIFPLSYTLQDS